MTGSAISIHNVHSRLVDSEELLQIRGIGATKKQWLETLGIGSIQELAIASVQDIKSRLKQLGYVASRSEIDFWIAQACQIASSQPDAIAAEEDKESPPDTPIPLLSEDVDWQTTASLSVDFQTRLNPDHQETRVVLRHPETNTVEIWVGTQAEQAHQWMQKMTKAQSALPMPTCPIAVQISQLRLLNCYHPDNERVATEQQRAWTGAIARESPYVLEVALRFQGLPLDNPLDAFMRYEVQGYARHLGSGEGVNLGCTVVDALIGDREVYTAILPEMTFSLPGLYRLKVVATLLDLPCTEGSFKVPVLTVA